MPLLVANSRDDHSLRQEPSNIPPLFAGPLRDDLISRIRLALSDGDHEKAAALLHEADVTFPQDSGFLALHLICLKLVSRKAYCETTLQAALDELRGHHFTASIGKFREALALSRGYEFLERTIFDAAVSEAGKLIPRHWRVAEVMLRESAHVSGEAGVVDALWAEIEQQRREETIRVALDESLRAEHIEYLPHVRNRLAALAQTYPGDADLESRLRVLDSLLSQRIGDEREKNLRRLALFRDRLNVTENPATLRRFRDLVAPFADAYGDDPAFAAILDDVRNLLADYERAAALLAENRTSDSLRLCEQVLEHRPSNTLFRLLKEKAKSREWVGRLADATMRRARALEQNAQYAEAMDEWESLRAIAPHHPDLDSEVLHCAALKERSEAFYSAHGPPADEIVIDPEIVEDDERIEPPPSSVERPKTRELLGGFKIAITEEAWNHLKTGLAATLALLLAVLVLASNSRR